MTFPSSIVPGFDIDEATTFLTIANQTELNSPDNPPSKIKGIPPVPAPPANWQIVTSLTPTTTTLLDNFWQVWQNQDNPRQYVISVRGTVDVPASILADLLFPLIKAHVSLRIGEISIDLDLAQDEGDSAVVAGVHAGFLLSLLLMLFTTDRPLFATLAGFGQDDEVYITGHSQGAAIALLLTSLVRHSTIFFNEPTYKTYVFAPPKPGNDHYAYDLAQLAATRGYVYSIVSSQDWVPEAPFTLQGLGAMNTPNPVKRFNGALNPAIPAFLDGVVKDVERGASLMLHVVERELDKLIQEIKSRLGLASFPLTAAELGHPGVTAALDSSAFSNILDDIRGLVLPSLDYAPAGTLVPVFAQPGANPDDNHQFDFFWQHHLGNYLKYLQAQWGAA